MRAPHVTDLSGVDAAVYGIPFDTATSFRTGARFGPEAIRSASALVRPYHPVYGLNLVDALSIVDYGDLPVSPGDTERTYAQVEQGLGPLVEAGVFPAAMGGDHSVTLAELRALANRDGPLALVQLDAHADTWDEYFGQRYFHGTTFKRAVEERLLDATASVQAGMRGPVYAASDLGAARELGFTVVQSEELRELDAEGYGQLVREKVGERPVFLSGPPVRYPPLLRQAGIEGRVLVRAIIDTTGRVEPASVKVIDSPHPGFNEAARNALLQARFRGGRFRGRAVRVLITLPVDFRARG